jgi:hypothetical protein
VPTVVVEELGDEVDVGEEHAAAAVALEAQLVESPAGVLAILLEELKVLVPLVANNLMNWLNKLFISTLPQVKQRTGMIILSRVVVKVLIIYYSSGDFIKLIYKLAILLEKYDLHFSDKSEK